MKSEEELLISEFNEAKFQIYRLHNLWLECKKLREGGKQGKLRWKLDSVEIELFNDIVRLSNDDRDYKKLLEDINGRIEKACNSLSPKEIAPKLYSLLVEKEKLLREVQENSGKGSKYRDLDAFGI